MHIKLNIQVILDLFLFYNNNLRFFIFFPVCKFSLSSWVNFVSHNFTTVQFFTTLLDFFPFWFSIFPVKQNRPKLMKSWGKNCTVVKWCDSISANSSTFQYSFVGSPYVWTSRSINWRSSTYWHTDLHNQGKKKRLSWSFNLGGHNLH